MRTAIGAALSLALLTPAHAAAQSSSGVVLRGLVGVTTWTQNRGFGFGNGQSALWARDGAGRGWMTGGDVRNTRLTLTAGRTTAAALRAEGTLEVDFFGGFNGVSAFSDEQPLPRLRLAFADLHIGRTTVRVGQAFTPLAGFVPVSATHIAFPLGLGTAGVIGWRQPGLYVTRTLGDPASQGLRLSVQAGAFRGSWSTPDPNDAGSAGEASGLPQVEARIDLGHGTAWSLWTAAHWDRKRFVEGPGAHDRILTGRAVAGGLHAGAGSLGLQGGGYVGRAIGQQMAQIAQFGDLCGHGGWVQTSVTLAPGWSAHVFRGLDDPRDDDVLRDIEGAARLRNDLTAVSVQFVADDVTAALEWTHAATHWGEAGAQATRRHTGDQIAFSVVYRFSTEQRRDLAARE